MFKIINHHLIRYLQFRDETLGKIEWMYNESQQFE